MPKTDQSSGNTRLRNSHPSMEIYIITPSRNTPVSLRKRKKWKDSKSQWQLKTLRKHLIHTAEQLCTLTHNIHKTEKHTLDLCKLKPDQTPVCREKVGIKYYSYPGAIGN